MSGDDAEAVAFTGRMVYSTRMPNDSARHILRLLESAAGWQSGEELAQRLGVSRMSVAKHVAALRDAGHVIRARTRKGYFLEIQAEPVRSAEVAKHLNPRTKILGRREWREFGETGSTNNEAIAWALAGAAEGAVVAAERQTGGKGRKGRDWFSSPRGLAVSVVLRPGQPGGFSGITGESATRTALEAMRRAVAATANIGADTAESKKPGGKEPNDLYVNGKKICGILAETGWRGDEPDWLVLGVGCNVSVLPEEFPEAIAGRVTSLYAETGRAVSKNRLLAEFLNNFEEIHHG